MDNSQHLVSLDSDVGAKVFLKLTIRFRDDFPISGSFDNFHRDTVGHIMKDGGVWHNRSDE